MAKANIYATEAALCADFITWVKAESDGVLSHRKQVWTPYAETAGWDILLVGADGTQIGVEAKLRLNLKVLSQALPERFDHWHDEGPDFRAILVPEFDSELERLCEALGVLVFSPSWRQRLIPPQVPMNFRPDLIPSDVHGWHWWSPVKRCKLPAYVPDVVAGASGPVKLTEWKVGALRVIAILEVRGFVTRADFRELRIDPRRWTGPEGWLKTTERPGVYIRGESLRFDQQHPEVYAQVLAETRETIVVDPDMPPPRASALPPQLPLLD